MKRFLLVLLILIILSAIAGAVYYYYFRPQNDSDELILYGNVDVRQVDIGFRVPGQVRELFFEEGDQVRKGALMARLDKTPYNSQVSQSKANLEAIAPNLENAEKLLKRRKELIGDGGVSQEELDQAEANLSALKANYKAAEASVEIARDNLCFTEVYAPTDGVILTRIREPGTVVRESDPVYTLSVSCPVWIRAFVDEPQLGLVTYGMAADIYTDTEGGTVYTGRVGFISPVAEFTPKTVETTQLRTDLVYRLRIYADNPDNGLKQGMPVTVKMRPVQEKK